MLDQHVEGVECAPAQLHRLVVGEQHALVRPQAVVRETEFRRHGG